jgi:hypothetical protein
MLKIDELDTRNTTDDLLNGPIFRNVKKMPALFVIDRLKHIGTDVLNDAATWIFNEPSTVTVKRDGTGIAVADDGRIFARRSVRKGKKAPEGFVLAELDPFTGHAFGSEPIETSGFIKMFREAVENLEEPLTPGTFELTGPKINGNPEGLARHALFRHGVEVITDIPDMRTVDPDNAFEILKNIFTDFKKRGIEGVVWAGADNKRVKLRVYDFFGDPNRR